MPFKDREQKLAYMRAWRKRKMAEGYGKALYRRRAIIYRNEVILREAVRKALSDLRWIRGDPALENVRGNLREALKAAKEPGPVSQHMRKSDQVRKDGDEHDRDQHG